MNCCTAHISYSPILLNTYTTNQSVHSNDTTSHGSEHSVSWADTSAAAHPYSATYNHSTIADILSSKYSSPTLSPAMPTQPDLLQQNTALREFLFTDLGHAFMLNRLVSGSYTQTHSHKEQKLAYKYIAVDTEIEYIHMYDIHAVRGKPVQSVSIATLHAVHRLNNNTIQLVQVLNNKQYTLQLQCNNQFDAELWQLTYTWLLHAHQRAVTNNQKLELNNKQRHVNMVYCMELLCDYIELQQLDSVTQSELQQLQLSPQPATLYSGCINVDQLKRAIDTVDAKIYKCEDINRQLLVNGCAQMIELQHKIDALYAQNEQLQQNINAIKSQ